jgi:UDP-perosamine 4-acetyltransferase
MRVVLDILRRCGECEIVGLLDPNADLQGTLVGGVPVIGDDARLPLLVGDGISGVVIGVGGVGDTGPRRRLFDLAMSLELDILSALHPSAIIAEAVSLGRGVTIMAGVVVNAGATVGDNVIVNTGAIIEHDVHLGRHVHVASGATLAGGVIVDDDAHIGAGATVIQGLRIGQRAIIGAGAVVIRDVPPDVVVVGVPARVVRRIGEP